MKMPFFRVVAGNLLFDSLHCRDMTAEEIAKVSSIVKKEKERIMNSVSKYPDILD